MISGTALEMLQIIANSGGKASMSAVTSLQKVSTDYGRVVLNDIGRQDYIDVKASGLCEITAKGWELLKKKGPQKKKSR